MAFKAFVRHMSPTELLVTFHNLTKYILGEALSRAIYPAASASVWLR